MHTNTLNILLFACSGVLSFGIASAESVYWAKGSEEGSLLDAANYDPKKVPTVDDMFIVNRTENDSVARLTLPQDGKLTLGAARIANENWQNVFLSLNPGSELSFDGVENVVWVSQNGSYNTQKNATQFVLDRAKMTIGTKVFNVAGMNAVGYTNSIVLQSGSTLSVTNGSLNLHGGAYSPPYAGGPQVIIDVRTGSTFEILNDARLVLGRDKTTNYEGGGIGQGGALCLNGGTFDAERSTGDNVVEFTHAGSTTGRIDLAAGEMRLTESNQIVFRNQGDSLAVFRQTGGTITSGIFNFEKVLSSGSPHRVIDISGNGVFNVQEIACNLISWSGNNPRAILRIRGSKAFVSYDCLNPSVNLLEKVFFFQDYRLKGDAARDEFPVTRQYVRRAQWDGGKGGYTKRAWGVFRVSPEGGAQLLHTEKVDLLCRDWQGPESFETNHVTYGGFVGADMWAPIIETIDKYPRPDGTTGLTHVFGAVVKPEAKLPEGVALANPVVRGFVEIPRFGNMKHLIRASVRLELLPQGDETVTSLVARLRDEGGVDAFADETVSPYNVRIDLNKDDLAEKVTTDKMILDFAQVETFDQAVGGEAVKTNALIRTATCELVKTGFTLLLR